MPLPRTMPSGPTNQPPSPPLLAPPARAHRPRAVADRPPRHALRPPPVVWPRLYRPLIAPHPPLKGAGRHRAIFCHFPSPPEDPPPLSTSSPLLLVHHSHRSRHRRRQIHNYHRCFPPSVRSATSSSPFFFGPCLTPCSLPGAPGPRRRR
jgi:hypothetical protein